MTPMLLDAVMQARSARIACVVATRIADGAQRLVRDAEAGDGLAEAAMGCIAADCSARLEIGGEDWFFHLHAPAPLLVVVGAVHIAQSLAPMARLAGAEVVVCDPRARYATAERFADTVLRVGWPDEVIPTLGLDRNSALVALSHDPKIDDPALQAALATACGYIGALGSRRSHAARLARLAERGLDGAAAARILGPVGLDLRAVGAAEIAVSILAEWIAQRRGGAVRPRG